MDKIFEGIIKSNYFEDIKKALFQKFLSEYQPRTLQDSQSFLTLGIEWSLEESETQLLKREIGYKILKLYSENLYQSLQGVLNFSQIHSLFLLKSIPLETQIDVFKLMLNVPVNLENSENSNFLSNFLVTLLSSLSIETPNYNEKIEVIIQVFTKILWTNDDRTTNTLNQLLILCCSSSYMEDSTLLQLSPALGVILQNASLHLLQKCVNFLTSPQVTSENLEKTLIQMMQWPLNQNTGFWILGILQGLINAKRFSLLTKLTSIVCPIVFKQLYIRSLRQTAFSVLEFLLLGYQHSPFVFHNLLPNFEEFLKYLYQEKLVTTPFTSTPSSNLSYTSQSILLQLYTFQLPPFSNEPTIDIEENLCNLLHTLMFQYTGYPELYSSLLKQLHSQTTLSETDMIKKLSERTWTSVRLSSESDSLQFRPKSETGKVGLENLGNTCYLNSFIQCLFMTDAFRDKIIYLPIFNDKKHIFELQRTFIYLLGTQRPVFAPTRLAKLVPDWYQPGSQQDSSEYGRYLLDQIESEFDSIKKSNASLNSNWNFVNTLLGGMIESSICCKKCGHISSSKEKFVDISLALTESETEEVKLSHIIEYFLSEEELTGENQYFCDTCGSLQDASKLTSIESAPNHLILSLKRFSYSIQTKSRKKIMRDIHYTESLIVPTKTENVQYLLYAVIMHSGTSAEHGHYYSYARKSKDPTSPWILFNDSSVAFSSFENFTNIAKKFRNDVPYILFFRRADFQGQVPTGTLPNSLCKEVELDNARFLEEQEKYKLQQKKTSVPSISRNPYHKPDDNPGNGFDFLSSRYIF